MTSSEAREEKGSERKVLATLTVSHVSQHLFAGAPILYQSIREELALSLTQIGVMVGISNVLGGFLQISYSVAGRRIGRRLLLSGSNLLMSVGCFFVGLAGGFEGLVIGNVVAGFGQAGTHPVSSSIISQKWERKGVGTALSVFYGLGYVGNIISPLMLSWVALVAGWRTSFYLLAAILLLTSVLAFVGLRREASGEKAVEKGSGRSLWGDAKAALAVKGAIPILAAQAFISGGTGMGVMTTWVPVYMRDPSKGLGLSVFDAGVISSVATIGGVLGTIWLGRVGDKCGYLQTAMASLGVTTVTIYLLTLYGSYTILLVPHLFLLSMTTFSMSSLLQAHLARSARPAERDILLGLFFTFGFGVSSLWSTLLGSIIDNYSYNVVWLTMVAAGVGAMICLVIARRRSKVA